MSPRQGGGWTETVLHNFHLNGTDGMLPNAGVIAMPSATSTVRLPWRHSQLWNSVRVVASTGRRLDGDGAAQLQPQRRRWYHALCQHNPHTSGNLYGTTYTGGIHNYGTVFELSPRQGGGWTEKVLHSFGGGTDGTSPNAGLIFDTAGNLYGTTYLGGIHGFGTAFEMSPKQGGGWTR